VQTVPTPTPSRGTPVEPADALPGFADDTPTRPEPLVGNLPETEALAGSLAQPQPSAGSLPAFESPADEQPEDRQSDDRQSEDRPEEAPESRRAALIRRFRQHLPYGLVLLTLAIGLVRIVLYHWREGSAWIGGALLLAGFLRAVLPPRTVGIVAVRGRAVDVLWCVGLAVCILFVAYTLKA
jgi:hypothetical protein